MLRTIILLTTFALTIFSCENNKTTSTIEEHPTEDYLPLTVGNYWKYIDKEEPEYNTLREWKVVSKKANGFEIEEINSSSRFETYGRTLVFRHTESGFEFVYKGETQLRLRKPFQKGNQWDAVNKDWHFYMEITAIDTTITVPVGTFKDVLVVKDKIPKDQIDFFYYALGVGIVKLTHYVLYSEDANADMEEAVLKDDWELVEYGVR